MSNSERRSTRRIPFIADAELEGISVGHADVRLSELGAGGAFVDLRDPLPVGTTARLKFTVLGREITVLAEVRYSMPAFGMGVQFLDLQPEGRHAIEELVAQTP